jgi:hypothetical protein
MGEKVLFINCEKRGTLSMHSRKGRVNFRSHKRKKLATCTNNCERNMSVIVHKILKF